MLPTEDGVFLYQHKYIQDLLDKAKMSQSKEVHTPMCPNNVTALHDGTSLTVVTKYRSMVGGLQYLSLTRPNLAFAVNKLSQFMRRPTTEH